MKTMTRLHQGTRRTAGRARARIDAGEVYRVRNIPAAERATDQDQPTRTTPLRRRSFGELARAYYDGSTGAEELIPSGPRGGAS